MTSLHHTPDHRGATQRHTHTHTHWLHHLMHTSPVTATRDQRAKSTHTHTCQKDVQLINTLLPLTPDTSSKTAGLYASAGNQPHSLTDEWQLLPMSLAMETVWIQENPCKQQTGPPQSQAPLTLHANKTLKTPEGDNGLAMD